MLAAGKGPAGKNAGAAAIGGVGLARAAGLAGLEVEEAAEDERYLRQVNIQHDVISMCTYSSMQPREGLKRRTHDTTTVH